MPFEWVNYGKKYALLDMDNTLIHSEMGVLEGAENAACRELRKFVPGMRTIDVRRAFEAAKKEQREAGGKRGSGSHRAEALRRLVEKTVVPAEREYALKETYNAYFNTRLAMSKVFPDTVPALKALRKKGYGIVIYTARRDDEAIANLARHGLAPFIDALVTTAATRTVKDAPFPVERLGRSKEDGFRVLKKNLHIAAVFDNRNEMIKKARESGFFAVRVNQRSKETLQKGVEGLKPLESRKLLKKLEGGLHSAPALVQILPGEKHVLKVYGKEKKLTFDEAKELAGAIGKYAGELTAAKIRIPHQIMTHPLQESLKGRQTGHWVIGHLEEFVGKKTAADIIGSRETSDARALALHRQMLEETFVAVSTPRKEGVSQKWYMSPVSLDLKPENFVLGRGRKLYYIDLFTPKLWRDRKPYPPFMEKLHKIGEKEHTYRFFDIRGMFANLLAYSVAHRPLLKQDIEKTTLDFLKEKGLKRVAGYLKREIANNGSAYNMLLTKASTKVQKARLPPKAATLPKPPKRFFRK